MAFRKMAVVVASLWATVISADPILFGYAAVSCAHDDPHDQTSINDYAEEVAAFTTANQVCVSGDMIETADRLSRTAHLFTPVFYIEPVFFEQRMLGLRPNPNAHVLWGLTVTAIEASGVPPEDLIFYLVDEPSLRRLPLKDVANAADILRETYPDASIMMIEAFAPNEPVHIPQEIDIWGFNTYALRDPAADPDFMRQLNTARRALNPDQSLVMVFDANFTHVHAAAGLSESDMADVALAYANLARSIPEVSILMGYTWAGGIDGLWEKGVRDLPEHVISTHRNIGLSFAD